jgi:hypothetical protein
MTLSGGNDRQERADAARAAWREKHDAQVSKRTWVMPLMIGIAVAVLVVCVVISIANGWMF